MTEIIYEDYIEYRSVFNKKFTKTYLKLTSTNLLFYSNENDTKERLSISFETSLLNCQITNKTKITDDKVPFCFEITSDKCYQFQCQDKTEYVEWINRISLYCPFYGVFGYPLDCVCDRKKSGWRFPIPLYRSIEFLRKEEYMKREEIFRSSCNGVDLNRVKDIIHSGHDICDKDFGQDGVIIASNIVKSFIRELPDGFIPYSFYNQFLGAGCINV